MHLKTDIPMGDIKLVEMSANSNMLLITTKQSKRLKSELKYTWQKVSSSDFSTYVFKKAGSYQLVSTNVFKPFTLIFFSLLVCRISSTDNYQRQNFELNGGFKVSYVKSQCVQFEDKLTSKESYEE